MKSLQDKLASFTNPVEMLRNAPTGPYQFPIASEFSNWRDEQRAWAETAVLFDQSHHMTDLVIEGPDTVRLLSEHAINSFKGYGRDKAKQYVACNPDGFVIGDAILFGLEVDKALLVGRPPVANWLTFRAENGGYDVQLERDERSFIQYGPRTLYRFEVQGPNAWAILEALNGGPIEGIRFFGMGSITIAGRKVRCLRHGMAGAAGLEFWGPFEEREEIRAAVLAAGADFGLLQGGARTYSTAAPESGWLPSPMTAIYADEAMRPYREWLPAGGFEANASLGGSFVSERIEDYYLRPKDIGYHFGKFDHDFVGREALEAAGGAPHKRKVTLVWDEADVVRIFASHLGDKAERFKYLDVPASHYAAFPYDTVTHRGRFAGFSTYPVYTANAHAWFSLALVDEGASAPGERVSIVWGEPAGGTAKPTVERHVQTEVQATVAASPFDAPARASYRS